MNVAVKLFIKIKCFLRIAFLIVILVNTYFKDYMISSMSAYPEYHNIVNNNCIVNLKIRFIRNDNTPK
jgi:hypothetical protein